MAWGDGSKCGLGAKQRQFVREFVKDLNATQAAIRAGYSVKGAESIGCQLIKNTKVAQAIEEAQEQQEKASGITEDYILAGIRDAIDMARTKGQAAIVLKGLELLGRHYKLGMWVDRRDITSAGQALPAATVATLAQVTDEQFWALAPVLEACVIEPEADRPAELGCSDPDLDPISDE